MPSEREQILKIIETLEHVGGRPGMFAGAKTVAAVGVFLNGFDFACGALGVVKAPGARRQAETGRGWKYGAEAWAMSQMRARGMTEEAMVDEMFAIEIATWRITAQALSD